MFDNFNNELFELTMIRLLCMFFVFIILNKVAFSKTRKVLKRTWKGVNLLFLQKSMDGIVRIK